MRKRIIIGTGLLLVLMAIAFLDGVFGRPILTVLAILGMTLQAQREFFSMSGVVQRGPIVLAQAAAAAAFAGRWLAPTKTQDAKTAMILVGLMLGLMFANLMVATYRLQKVGEAKTRSMMDASFSLFAFVYVAIPMGFLQEIAMRHGVAFAALMVLVSKCGDMGGYLVGSKIGKHRVMPNVSPKKSWEGSVGGLILTLFVLIVAQKYGVAPFRRWGSLEILVFGLSMNVATQTGDFAESMIKRCFAVKDSGDILPTFGGALDILDSLIFAMPVAAFFTCMID